MEQTWKLAAISEMLLLQTSTEYFLEYSFSRARLYPIRVCEGIQPPCVHALGGFFLRNERGELALHGPRPYQVLSFVRHFVSNRLGEAPTTRFGVPAVWVCPSPQRFRAPTTEPAVASRVRPTRRARICCGHERRGRVTILNFEFQSRRRRDATRSSVSYLDVCRNVRYSIVLAVTRAGGLLV